MSETPNDTLIRLAREAERHRIMARLWLALAIANIGVLMVLLLEGWRV